MRPAVGAWILPATLGGSILGCSVIEHRYDANKAALDAEAGVPLEGGAPDVATSSYAALVKEDRPIAYWRLGDSPAPDGGLLDLFDQMGNRSPCPRRGSPLMGIAGAIANDPDTAAQVDQYAGFNCGNDFPFLGNQPVTFECWVKRISGSGQVAGRSYGYMLQVNGNALMFTRSDGASVASNSLTRPLTANVWYHVVALYDGSDMKLYVNFDGQGSPERAASPFAIVKNNQNAQLPTFDLGHGYLWGFGGAIDEVAYYDYPLSEARIGAHFRAGSGK